MQFFVLFLESLTTSKHRVKDSFNFATEIVDQDYSNLIDSLGKESFFTNSALE